MVPAGQALRTSAPQIDVALAQEVGLTGVDDQSLLAWAATNNRIVLSHDYKTLPLHARRRIEAGQPVSGILLMKRSLPPAKAAEEIALRGECTNPADWGGQVEYLKPEPGSWVPAAKPAQFITTVIGGGRPVRPTASSWAATVATKARRVEPAGGGCGSAEPLHRR